jgi:DNA polymerase III subunit gamma/tau
MSEVLALKYRPKTFDEVIGQEQTVEQLKSALDKGTLGHALLFCGTRGTGKTTTARIVARELNRDFTIAKDWEHTQHLVLTEVDAASNTGVDNVREIIESIRYSTQGHRVVILDEAHMLSKNAFNALLKTLEEPPPGVTFILSTTEPNKLLPTVVSRCQKYIFSEVDFEKLAIYYKTVADKEALHLDFDVITKVALQAQGSVRDGLSILQKMVSSDEPQKDNTTDYFQLVGAIYGKDVATALDLISQIRKGEEARTIIQTLENWFYWCSLESFGMRTPVRDYFEDPTALDFDLSHLQQLFSTCLEIERSFTATPNSKTVLEMGVIRLCL